MILISLSKFGNLKECQFKFEFWSLIEVQLVLKLFWQFRYLKIFLVLSIQIYEQIWWPIKWFLVLTIQIFELWWREWFSVLVLFKYLILWQFQYLKRWWMEWFSVLAKADAFWKLAPWKWTVLVGLMMTMLMMIKIKMMVMNILAMVIKMMMAMANVHNLSKGKVVKTCIFIIICFSFLIICILFIIISHHQFNMLRVIIKTLKSP